MKNKLFSLSMLMLLITLTAAAQKSEVYSTDAGAIQGYDAVAFFTENKPVMGKKELTYSYNNATWHFASQQNLDLFKANPEKYAPQYGGYCAYGTSQGHKAPTQAETFTIVNDKLYFNYNPDVKKMWTKDQAGLIKRADEQWPAVKMQK